MAKPSVKKEDGAVTSNVTGETAIGSELRSLPFEYLIGAPLAAAAKAQVNLGKSMVSFVNMLAYGNEDTEAKPGAKASETLTISMKIEHPVIEADGSIVKKAVTTTTPILDLVPIPALLIDSVDINFTMDVHSATEKKGKVAIQRKNTRSTDKTAKYNVNVKTSQLPQTEGMSKLMDLLASTVEPISVEKKHS